MPFLAFAGLNLSSLSESLLSTCGFFELLAAKACLLPIQDQADGIALDINRRGAQVKVGPANGVIIEMLEIPLSRLEDRLPQDILLQSYETNSGGNLNASWASLRLAVWDLAAWGWGWVDMLRTVMRRRITVIGSELGASRSRGCYSTATNPRVGKTAKHAPRKARGRSWPRFGESAWWGDIRGRSQAVGLE